MKYAIYLLAIIILLGLNLGLFNNLQLKGQMPNLLFLLTLCYSLEKRDYDFFFISMISGVFLDFYSTGFFGAYTLAFLSLSLALHFFADNVLLAGFNWKTLTGALVASLFFFYLIVWLYGLVAWRFNWTVEYSSFRVSFLGFLPSLVYNLLFLYPVYFFSTFLKRTIDSWTFWRRGVRG